MKQCPCGLAAYHTCCGPYHSGAKLPDSPEQLMRSRYSAYALADIDYIKKTMHGNALAHFDEVAAKEWATAAHWLKLKILNTAMISHTKGLVEFEARFIENGKEQLLHENSEFDKIDGRWLYSKGAYPNIQKPLQSQKIGRNSPCYCGSQKKFKQCHGK